MFPANEMKMCFDLSLQQNQENTMGVNFVHTLLQIRDNV